DDAAALPETAAPADAGPDVDNGTPSNVYPAFKVDAPQVVTSGGPVLAAPKIVPVYFANDSTAFTDSITTFLNKLPTSTYWGPEVTEYGVGAISIATPVQLTENAVASTTDTDIKTWLTGKMSDPAFPAADANTIYVLFYPTGTTISLGQSGTSCQAFGGYHDNIAYQTNNVAFAVIPRCSSFGGLTGLNAVSATSSHEIIEAATDPYPTSNPAYGQVDNNHLYWEFVLGGGETADMCAQFPGAFYVPNDIGNDVQRSWSNVSAKAGHDPCLPADGTPYFNSVPVLPDTLSLGGGQFTSKGIHIPLGQSATVEIDLFSDAATSGPWTVSAMDSAALQGSTPNLSFAWDRTTGQNGEKLHLTITVKSVSQYNAEAFMLESKLGGRTNLWLGLVGN
ncbi:MAG TPA: hypothetical protein VLM85_25895, partial [Polyangiaceae bacterium]|nr:hypothetical protein [Polyangiaceae bacterium]